MPPGAEIEDLLEPRSRVGELALVDEKPGVRAARGDLVGDRVEGQLAHLYLGAENEPQDEVGRREPTGNDDLELAQLIELETLPGDEQRSVAESERRAVGEQDVAVGNRRVGPERDRTHLERPSSAKAVERLDVGHYLLELEAAQIDASGLDSPEHEGVVGIRAVADTDGARTPR